MPDPILFLVFFFGLAVGIVFVIAIEAVFIFSLFDGLLSFITGNKGE